MDRADVRDTLIKELGLKDSSPSPHEGSKRKREQQTITRPILQDIELPLTDIDARHETYTALLSKLSLASDHRENLLSRGMTEEMIQRNGYKTMPVAGFSAIAKQLHEEGYYLAGVPGFYHDTDGSWTINKEKRGILVPARTPEGKIQGLQVRLDFIKKGKFRWLTSIGKQDGCKAECWTHIAGEPTSTILLTEGPMKADIIHHITGQTVIAVPGVNSLNHLKETLEYVQSKGTTKIMTVFDMDYLKNPHVKDGYFNLATLLAQVGFEYGMVIIGGAIQHL